MEFNIYFHFHMGTLDSRTLLGWDTRFQPFGRLEQVLYDRRVKYFLKFVWLLFLKSNLIKANVTLCSFFFFFFL